MEQQRLMLRVRVESGIPKLLVKINPSEAEGFSAKNLGEVKLRKASAQRGHVAVLHMSYGVPPGELVMSLKLAEILDVDEEESVELTSAMAAAGAAAAAAPVSGAATERPAPRSTSTSTSATDALRHGSAARAGQDLPEGINGSAPDASWFQKAESKYAPQPSLPTDRRFSAPWGASATTEQPAAGHSRNFDRDWFRGLGFEQEVLSSCRSGRSQSAFTSSSDRRAEQIGARQPFTGFQDLPTSAHSADSLPSTAPEAPAASPEWLRDLRSFAEWDVRQAGRSGSAADAGGSSAAPSSSFSGGGSADPLSGFGASGPGAAHDFYRSSLRGGDDRGSWGLPSGRNSNSHSFAAADSDAATGVDASKSRSGLHARDAAFPSGMGRFDLLGDSGKPLSSSPLPAEVSGRVASNVDEKYQAVDSLPASESSDCECSKAPEAAHGLKADRTAAGTADGDFVPRDLGGLSAAADLSAATVDWRRSLERVAAEPSWSRHQPEPRKAAPCDEDTGRHPEASVWDAPTPQRQGTAGAASHGHPVVPTVAESLEPSPRDQCGSSHPSTQASSCSVERGTTPVEHTQAESSSSTSSRQSPSPPTSSPRNEPALSSPPVSSPRNAIFEQAHFQHPSSPSAPRAIVPCTTFSAPGKNGRLLSNRKTVTLGSLYASEDESLVLPLAGASQEPREPVPSRWRPPSDLTGGGLERSELGSEVTAEVRLWLLGETSGRQCSQVVLDRALTVLANFKLASGCQLEVLGGPLGAIVGGYSDADWLHDEVFRKQPTETVREAFALLGFRGRADGDWSSIAAEEVSLTYRRLCLRGHPSRGGAPRGYLKLQVAMELVRAFAGEAGPLELGRTPRGKERTPSNASSSNACGDVTPPSSRFGIPRSSSKADGLAGFVLNDVALVRELQLTAAQAEEEAGKIPQEQLEEMNRALDEYILRQMCFKSEIVDEIARLHEDCAYAILGVSSGATDSEIKKAYRLIARSCHPDKGGDKEDFQELTNAYEKIMEQRRSTNDPWGKPAGDEEPSEDDKPDPFKKEKRPEKETGQADKDADDTTEDDDAEGDQDAEDGNDKADEADEDEYGDEGSNASLVEKSGKAAEEASRYAKTAAEFAHQAAEAAETARRGREQGSRDTLTKSIAHSAIVLTLTVVKAVRVVGYATLDVAAQCRIAAKRNPNAVGCAERAVTAMSLGLEALNAALACAEVTETTAAELQAPAPATEGANSGSSSAAAERFVGAAVRASLAAASASNAAMSAAIAAVEGSRECARAVEEQQKEAAERKQAGERSPEEAAAAAFESGDVDEEAEDAESAEPQPPRPPPPTAEEAAAAATRRLVAQRNNNHKVLQRLNAEILGHQQNVRQFLAANRQLIPDVSGEAKQKVFGLLHDYSMEARLELERFCQSDECAEGASTEELLLAVREQSLLIPFAQDQALAIPVSVKARVLKMAALYDLTQTMQVLEQVIFTPLREALPQEDEARIKLDELCARIREELGLHTGASAPER